MSNTGVLVAGAVLALVLAGCTNPRTNGDSPATPTSVTTTAAPRVTAPDAFMAQACQKMVQAIRDGKTGDPDTLIAIGQLAAKSSNEDMRNEGNGLAWFANIMITRFQQGDTDRSVLWEAADEFERACVAEGL